MTGAVHFEDALVVGVGDKSVAVAQSTGEGGSAEQRAGRATVASEDMVMPVDFDHPVIVFVGDQNVAVAQQLGAVRVVQLIEAVSADSGLTILPDNFLVERDFDNAFVDAVAATRGPVLFRVVTGHWLLPLTTCSKVPPPSGLGIFLASYRSMTNSSPTSVRLRKMVCAGSSITLSARSFGRIIRKGFTNSFTLTTLKFLSIITTSNENIIPIVWIAFAGTIHTPLSGLRDLRPSKPINRPATESAILTRKARNVSFVLL